MGWLVPPTNLLGSLAETFCDIIELISSKHIQTDATSKRIIKGDIDLNSIIIKSCLHCIYYFESVFTGNTNQAFYQSRMKFDMIAENGERI